MQNDLCPGGEGFPPQLPGQDVARSVVGLVYPVDLGLGLCLEFCGWKVSV